MAFLEQTHPPWFDVESTSDSEVVGAARPPGTVWAAGGVALRLRAEIRVVVSEAVPGARFPARCPERHIQADQTFCLGLAPVQPTSDELAGQFWEQLRQYLVCQHVAEETGVWPPLHALSHGAAGEHHQRALELAEALGCTEEYDRARLGEVSWITDRRIRIASKTGQPINGRMPCPLGCRYTRRSSREIPLTQCRKRDQLAQLVFSEQERRRELADYWADAVSAGETCCGRMRNCGLPRPENSRVA